MLACSAQVTPRCLVASVLLLLQQTSRGRTATYCTATNASSKRPRQVRQPKPWNPESLVIRRDDIEQMKEPVPQRTRSQDSKWRPKHTLPHHIMQQIRMLHKEDPETYSARFLMEKYHAPFQAIVRILKSKFEPSPEKIAKLESLWIKRKIEKEKLELEKLEKEKVERERLMKSREKKATMDTTSLMRLITHKQTRERNNNTSPQKTIIQNNKSTQNNSRHARDRRPNNNQAKESTRGTNNTMRLQKTVQEELEDDANEGVEVEDSAERFNEGRRNNERHARQDTSRGERMRPRERYNYNKLRQEDSSTSGQGRDRVPWRSERQNEEKRRVKN